MRVEPECATCAMRQVVSVARLVTADEDKIFEILKKAAAIMSEADWKRPPPLMGEEIYGMVADFTGVADLFRELKVRENRMVQEMLPEVRKMVEEADDSFLAAVKVSIAGNTLDPGAQESYDVVESVARAMREEGEMRAFSSLVSDIERAGRVLFLADNCGEIVLDTVLIEEIKERFGCEVILAVKESPILNDVTLEDARDLGLDRICELISTGLKMPGTHLPRANPEFRRIFEEADVVISKGQGNWETLEECERRVYFLFQAKCETVARRNDCRQGENLLLCNC